MRYSRRQFLDASLRTAPLVPLASSVPWFLARSLQAQQPPEPARDGRVLVVIELNGGNDGINTIVPYKDEAYVRHRKTLRIPAAQVLKLNDEVGLHPAMRGAADLIEDGRLTIVQGVGYPNPSRSHFRSMEIWQSARLDGDAQDNYGWLGRALDHEAPRADRFADSLCVGDVDPPLALRGRRSTRSTIRRLEDVQLDPGGVRLAADTSEPSADELLQFVRRQTVNALATSDRISKLASQAKSTVRYPNTDLGGRLKTIARLLQADLQPRAYYTVQSGYDTHVDQFNDHYGLLAQFSGALKAFLDDLRETKLAERVLVMVFSEFGRRVDENGSQGTDHGTAGPMFLAGPVRKAGLYGATPSLDDLEDEDLKRSVDFRDVYATILQRWLALPHQASLGSGAKTLPLL